MKTLIIYAGRHHDNTKKIAEAFHEELGGEICSVEEAGEKKISEYDLVLFGSGIYRMRIHKALRRFLEQLPKQEETPTIYFLTSGFDSSSYGEEFRDILSEKGFRILGGYRTLGWMTFGPVFFLGGINKGKPGEKEEAEAKAFLRRTLEKL